MTNTWFTADLHLGHTLVSELRGFGRDTDEHDHVLAAKWDRCVKPGDHVWVLGDISIGRGFAQDHALDWISKRNGIKHLIWGNHDCGHPMHRDAHKVQWEFLSVFESVQERAVRQIAGHRVLLSHFPYSADHTEVARYPEWRFPDTGKWLIHGHTHSNVKRMNRQLHVGLDAHALYPVPLKWIVEQIAEDS